MSKPIPPNPKAYNESIKRLKKHYAMGRCLAPFSDHGGDIISAHTLSVGSMLKPIARDGHVYAWKSDFYPNEPDKAFDLNLSGIYQTSVFNGFCGQHDSKLFDPIDNSVFKCQPQQLFLHAYRAVAKESYGKRKQLEAFPTVDEWAAVLNIPDASNYVPHPDTADYLDLLSKGMEGIETFKATLDQIFIDEDYRRLVTCVLPFNAKACLVCNSVFIPESDYHGVELQRFDRLDIDLNYLMITILPLDVGGVVLLSYLDNRSHGPVRLIESLLSEQDVTSALVWLIVNHIDNVAISPAWWEKLTDNTKDQIRYGFRRTLDRYNRPMHLLIDNPLKLDDWKFGKAFQI